MNSAGTLTLSIAGTDTLIGIEGLIGGSGRDTLTGDGVDNRLDGGIGNDTLAGSGGDDTLDGGANDDTLDGGTGNDVATYGSVATAIAATLNSAGTLTLSVAGNDRLIGIEGLIGGTGDDTLTGDGVDNRLDGGAGSDTLTGGAGNDTLAGGFELTGVRDTLLGGLGDDTLTASTSTVLGVGDLLDGGGDNDTLTGGARNDTLDGGTGNDVANYGSTATAIAATLDSAGTLTLTLVVGGTDVLIGIEGLIGGSGNDTLTGDSGANGLDGGGGRDTLSGADGDDWLAGGGETIGLLDTLLGGLGDDTLTASTGSVSGVGDQLYGGVSNDLLAGGGRDDVLDGGSGNDVADFGAATGGFAATLNSAGTLTLTVAGTDVLIGIEGLIGGTGDDTLTGDGVDNALGGGGGGNDTLAGGDGNDTLTGGAGNDSLDGGDGNDTASWDGEIAVLYADLRTGGGHVGGALTDLMTAIEHLTGGSGDDMLVGDTGAKHAPGRRRFGPVVRPGRRRRASWRRRRDRHVQPAVRRHGQRYRRL